MALSLVHARRDRAHPLAGCAAVAQARALHLQARAAAATYDPMTTVDRSSFLSTRCTLAGRTANRQSPVFLVARTHGVRAPRIDRRPTASHATSAVAAVRALTHHPAEADLTIRDWKRLPRRDYRRRRGVRRLLHGRSLGYQGPDRVAHRCRTQPARARSSLSTASGGASWRFVSGTCCAATPGVARARTSSLTTTWATISIACGLIRR